MNHIFAFIGGSGLYELPGATLVKEHDIVTPFGSPSAPIKEIEIAGKSAFFLPRHGVGHSLLPSEIPFKANIWALKSLGVDQLVSFSAVGSLKERYKPGHIVIPDQFIDRTRHRPESFFGEGIVAHVPFGNPSSSELSSAICEQAMMLGFPVHRGGTYICMEGPQFSTKAESHLYRSFDADIIGMTLLQEAKLAREAEIAFCGSCSVTDYDCWKEDEEDVTVEQVLETLRQNADNANKIAEGFLKSDFENEDSEGISCCLDTSIMTPVEHWPAKTAEKLEPILSRYKKGK